MQIAPFLQWVLQEPSSPPLMEPHGLQGLLGLQILFGESPMQNKEWVRLREKSDSLFNQRVHLSLLRT